MTLFINFRNNKKMSALILLIYYGWLPCQAEESKEGIIQLRLRITASFPTSISSELVYIAVCK